MKNFKTEQEKFWAGEFGNEYIKRNNSEKLISSNTALFSKILSNTTGIKSVIEFGSNIGLNLIAIRKLIPDIELSGVEVNSNAAMTLKDIDNIKVYEQSIIDYKTDYKRDLSLIKCVLIHINPDLLADVYEILYNSSNRYVCVAEYYNPKPTEIEYRGHTGKLFKRDFAGEMLDRYKDLTLVDYGFVYHRDCNFPQDDITWFLLEKQNRSE